MSDLEVPQEWQDAVRFAEALSELDEAQLAYVSAAVSWLEKDDSGEITKLLERHRAGERVADTYFDMATREVRTLAQGEPVPERWEPILGELEVSHE